MTTHLKRCPFCGGVAALYSNYSYKTRTHFVFVRCTMCHAQGRSYSEPENPIKNEWNTEKCDAAVNAWNTRSNGDYDE